jgi:murein DD-endopeptidase MepM/ murein hydrolase activator NlpD
VFLDHVVGDVHYQSLYAHLSSVASVTGAVSTSTMLGRAGGTGTGTARVELHLAIYRGASFATNDPNGMGPYGGEAVIPEPFVACTKDGGPCESREAGAPSPRHGMRKLPAGSLAEPG